MRFEYHVQGRTEIFQDQSTAPESGEFVTSNNVVSGKVYLGRATITTVPDRFKTWTPWYSTVLATGRASIATYLNSLGSDIRELLRFINIDLDGVRARMEQLALAASDTAGVVASENSVAVKFRNANALAMSGLSASVEEIDGQLVAIASAVTAVEASVGAATAEGLFRYDVQVVEGGDVRSRAISQIRASVDDVWVSAGWYMEAGFTGGDPTKPFSQLVLKASKIVMVNDDGVEYEPIVFEGGKLKLAIADIGEFTAGRGSSPDGTFVIDFANGFHSIEWGA